MKRYTRYITNRKDYDKMGWQCCGRKQMNDIDSEIQRIKEVDEICAKYGYAPSVYKFVDNETKEVVKTNA